MAERPRVYAEAEIAARLAADLPKWRLENGWICRRYRTHSWKGALMAVNAIGHLAEAAWHHPELTVAYASVEVKLRTHDAKGITEKDFELARIIEEVIGWRPAEGAALEGTPQDARFAYLKYE